PYDKDGLGLGSLCSADFVSQAAGLHAIWFDLKLARGAAPARPGGKPPCCFGEAVWISGVTSRIEIVSQTHPIEG
ncbi:hypothetical protein, partial [Rhodoferax sp.]|uniref:hypothetical protein n=1 Tax=Rhodoferax sp. TaxID=50421 RepID=UPI0025F314A2